MRRFDFVIAGGGPAGAAAAQRLLGAAHRPSVLLVGDEPHAPYERPPLSKAVLLDAAARARPVPLFGGDAGLVAAGAECRFGDPVVDVALAARRVTLRSGATVNYGALLWATGAAPRRLAVPGAGLNGVHYLRTFDEALRLSSALPVRHVTVIGGGFIGLEVAAAAAQLGCGVAVVEAAPRLLGRAVPPQVSEAVARLYTARGVQLKLGTGVQALLGQERVQAVRLAHGDTLETDLVVAGIGAVPNDAVAREAGLAVDQGILVDALGRTSDPHCFAAGDVARRPAGLAWHPDHRHRLEAWEPALDQGRAVACAMLGEPVPALAPPWVWSNLFDWNLQMTGHGELSDGAVSRPGRDPDHCTVFQLRGDRLVGAVTVNDGRHMALLRREMGRCPLVDPARLADPTVPLRDALKPPSAADSLHENGKQS